MTWPLLTLILRHWRLLAAVCLAAGLWLHGHHTGAARCQAAHAAAEAAADRARAAALSALAAAEQETRRLSYALEDAANADPPSAGACLPVSRVLRLNQR